MTAVPITLPVLADEGSESLIDRYIAEQQRLSAVDRFARLHEADQLPAQAKYYRDLIPLTAPGAGQQYAFDVDLDACTGCKACVTACHNLNGLDDGEVWRDVGLLVGGTTELPILQHVTTACHHCLEPACMHGCPVNAYEKDAVTGIVRHLDDQCIGCQYCILKCPYDVPKYNKAKGIVRKCDMCSQRLTSGEAPACVQSCPNEAIRITVVDRQTVIEDNEANLFLPGTADPEYTLPTTNYRSARGLPRNTLPADYYRVTPEHAHLPLVVMLVLTQLSAGAFAIGQLLSWHGSSAVLEALRPTHAVLAMSLGMLALGASVLHLGRPLYAFRAIVGLGTSWLSREIVAFGLFAKLSLAYAAVVLFSPSWCTREQVNILGTATWLSGLVGVFCSVMIYHDTRRILWRFHRTATRFTLTMAVLGLSITLQAATVTSVWRHDVTLHEILSGWGVAACLALVMISSGKLLLEISTLRHLWARQNTPMKRTARLLTGPLLRPLLARLASGLIGGVVLPLLAWLSILQPAADPLDLSILLCAGFLMTLLGELLERYLFFAAVVAPRMPGGFGK